MGDWIVLIIVSLLTYFLVGCGLMHKVAAPPCPDADDRIRVGIQTNRNEVLNNVVSDLNVVYGEPTIEVSAFRSESGEYMVMEKLYYNVRDDVFVVVSVVNERILMIDTVHAPEREIKDRSRFR